MLISLAGVGAGLLAQLRHVLASPAVAEDEASLTADVIMRVEDARALVTPSLVWSLPPSSCTGNRWAGGTRSRWGSWWWASSRSP
ncbi:hypothetical protein [Actinomadura madurae]|uniref:hypothetical protein n=1 Tax=Actinomadura madurae TaxID=1993 RepID=UPI0020D1FB24|nr:hypothetical protein [Actinomadura madurae]MCQ0017353.1 hypothetical protein [Actinomadura madurae]